MKTSLFLIGICVLVGFAVWADGEPERPVRFDLVYPNYRGLIFPSGGAIEVEVTLDTKNHDLKPGQLTLILALPNKNPELEGTTQSRQFFGTRVPDLTAVRPMRHTHERVSLPTGYTPEGPATLKASLVKRHSGEVLASQEWTVRKLTSAEADNLKVYIDRNMDLIVDGKPFFPLGWYGNTKDEYLQEIADSPFNCLLAYGANHVPKDTMLRFLDVMNQRGLKLIYCMNDVYPTATYFDGKEWEGVKGNDAIAAAVVEAYRQHPAILAWYLNDELSPKLVPQLEDYYQRVLKGDADHPCFIVLCNKDELPFFPTTTDIMGVDPYPIPSLRVTRVSMFADAAKDAVRGLKPVWAVPQAFAWYQYNSKNPDRSHIPTEDELKSGRAPTFDEERCMTYLALTHGAKGLIYYCYYDLRVLPQYNDMWAWMKRIAQEVKTLSPMLLAPDDLGTVPVSPDNGAIHTKLKQHDGRLSLMAVNARREPCQVTFTLKRKLPSEVEVLFENRNALANGKRLGDAFKPLEVHVYDLGPTRK